MTVNVRYPAARILELEGRYWLEPLSFSSRSLPFPAGCEGCANRMYYLVCGHEPTQELCDLGKVLCLSILRGKGETYGMAQHLLGMPTSGGQLPRVYSLFGETSSPTLLSQRS